MAGCLGFHYREGESWGIHDPWPSLASAILPDGFETKPKKNIYKYHIVFSMLNSIIFFYISK